MRLEEAGVLVSAVLLRAGLPQNLFEQTRILVSTEELFALWRAIGEVGKDPAIGLRLGTETSIARFHPMGIAALSTESFGAAIDHMARYKKLSAPEEILHETVEGEWASETRQPLRLRYTSAPAVSNAAGIDERSGEHMAISETARGNHEELFPGHTSTLAMTDPELIEVFDTRVAGMYAWNQLGRRVKKGEKGIRSSRQKSIGHPI